MNSIFVLEFLRIYDEKLFNKKKSELNKIKKPTKTIEIPSSKGFVYLFLI